MAFQPKRRSGMIFLDLVLAGRSQIYYLLTRLITIYLKSLGHRHNPFINLINVTAALRSLMEYCTVFNPQTRTGQDLKEVWFVFATRQTNQKRNDHSVGNTKTRSTNCIIVLQVQLQSLKLIILYPLELSLFTQRTGKYKTYIA